MENPNLSDCEICLEKCKKEPTDESVGSTTDSLVVGTTDSLGGKKTMKVKGGKMKKSSKKMKGKKCWGGRKQKKSVKKMKAGMSGLENIIATGSLVLANEALKGKVVSVTPPSSFNKSYRRRTFNRRARK